jgi:hypothetical protein
MRRFGRATLGAPSGLVLGNELETALRIVDLPLGIVVVISFVLSFLVIFPQRFFSAARSAANFARLLFIRSDSEPSGIFTRHMLGNMLSGITCKMGSVDPRSLKSATLPSCLSWKQKFKRALI